ncbi:TPA: hypothetical protein ACOEOW_003882 [Enterobacter hormaechei subsp. xiangfangensis]
MTKTIFIVNVEPFAHRTPDAPVGEFIYEHELVEETEDNYITVSVFSSQDIVRYPRELYTAFDTRDEALIHLERIVLDKVQELENELDQWKQFNSSIEVEIMKS